MGIYGIQLYSLRDISENDLKGALKAVSDMGYSFVEFAGFFGNPASDVKKWLDEYSLCPIGTHTKLPELTPDKIDEVIAYHKKIGCTNIIVPSANWSTEENMNENIDALNRIEKKLNSSGITLSYHNHSGEFLVTPYGKIVEDEIIARTNILLEVDTFWLFNAGIDPIPYLEANKSRIKMVHLKDGIPADPDEMKFSNSNKGAVGTSLGLGKAPVAAVCEWAIANGVALIVESEGLEPSGCEEVKRCIDYLKTLEK